MYGERIYKWKEVLSAWDQKNDLYGYIVINPERKKGWFAGGAADEQRTDFCEGCIMRH